MFIWPALILMLAGCEYAGGRGDRETPPTSIVSSGAEILVRSGFRELLGKRVGLIVNHTSRANGRYLVDLIHEAENVEIAALFGPEHGIRGDEDAGTRIEDGVDDATGAPVYSLYGKNRRPTPEMLKNVDALIFDIQDVGSRFYTYISTLGVSMQSASEAGIPFYVLDRPNPLGGIELEGFVRDSSHVSFVGLYPIPVRHGLTVGELAQMILGEAWLPGLAYLDLQIIRMDGWSRDMLWPETGIEWIPTSPNIPTFETALLYAGTCFFEATSASEGRGTDSPFLTIGAPWMDSATVSEASFSGLAITTGHTTPVSIPGKSANPKWRDVRLSTITLSVTDANEVRPVSAGLELISRLYGSSPDSVINSFFDERWMALLAGTDAVLPMIKRGLRAEDFQAAWSDEVAEFNRKRQKYLLYD